MNLWHQTPDAPRTPARVSAGEQVTVRIGTWPIEPGQSVWVVLRVESLDGGIDERRVDGAWERNEGSNSLWCAGLGAFAEGDRVTYSVRGRGPAGEVAGGEHALRVGPKLLLALLWHQHQPLYRDLSRTEPRGSYVQPWVRLHALRDYLGMASIVAEHPGVHLTINLTPSLLQQLEDYTERGATDEALELTLQPAEALDDEQRATVLERFFDADWHHQVLPHPRYAELGQQRRDGRPFSAQDLRDLQMWFNLAWFGPELRAGDVPLATGEVASVRRFVEQGRGYTHADVEAMVAEQHRVLRAIVPLHRALLERGQVDVSTSPLYHPILPLLIDSDRATLDLPGATLPRRFAHPGDAQTQVEQAVDRHERWFGTRPGGMWPAEGAVSQEAIPMLAWAGARWIATDAGVLAQSGTLGYQAHDPDVLTRVYRAHEGAAEVAVFFRDPALSDAIGFRYAALEPEAAAAAFISEVKERFARRLSGEGTRVLTIVVDGENPWTSYADDGRPFLHALATS